MSSVLFQWFKKRRRQRILAEGFPPEWEHILKLNAVFMRSLPVSQQSKIRADIQILVAEKNWEGCGGLTLSDEHRITVAAQIARMTLHFEAEYFDDVQSILLYPVAYTAKASEHLGSGVVVEGPSDRLGEAWYRGPVILAWADVLHTARHSGSRQNVVIHEFAHQLDMRNGSHADGYPTIESPRIAEEWLRVMPQALERLTELCRSGVASVLDCYGATNPAEFFAVASESYFQQPKELKQQWPHVFELLDGFYYSGSSDSR